MTINHTITFITAKTYDETYINNERITNIIMNDIDLSYDKDNLKYLLNVFLHGDVIEVLNIADLNTEIPVHKNDKIFNCINNYIKTSFNVDIFIDLLDDMSVEYLN